MRIVMAVLAMMGIISLVGCNTVQGIGQDIQKAGGAIEKAGTK